MKQLSLKAKLTLLYSVIMAVIFSITMGILFYFSSNEILTSTRSMISLASNCTWAVTCSAD